MPARSVPPTATKLFERSPVPKVPPELRPQHRAVPSRRHAQECVDPAVTPIAPLAPITLVGLVRRVMVPSPICP
ncbi:MAG: hypothetical protein R3A52_14955 [Polyangiales bacterium]